MSTRGCLSGCGPAGDTWAAAKAADSSGRGQTAGALYLQAAGYYAAALSQIAGSTERDRIPELWRRQRACWERAVYCAPTAGRFIEIPYEGTTLPGYFSPAPGSAGRRRPLVIMQNGAHLPTSSMWGLGGAAAVGRGYHWLTFDGPGQQAALFHRRLFFRPDWAAVLGPVLDAVIELPEVSPGQIAAVGFGQSGFWLPQALAHDHRLAAAAVFPGITDVTSAWTAALTPSLAQMLADGESAEFDRRIRAALLFDRRAAGRPLLARSPLRARCGTAVPGVRRGRTLPPHAMSRLGSGRPYSSLSVVAAAAGRSRHGVYTSRPPPRPSSSAPTKTASPAIGSCSTGLRPCLSR